MPTNYTSILPVIHSNGTSAKELYQDYGAAMGACATAITALQQVEFNGRDYYPLGDNAFTVARAEREKIMAGLRAAFEYSFAHTEQAQKAMKAYDHELPPAPVCYPQGDADTDPFTHEQEATRL